MLPGASRIYRKLLKENETIIAKTYCQRRVGIIHIYERENAFQERSLTKRRIFENIETRKRVGKRKFIKREGNAPLSLSLVFLFLASNYTRGSDNAPSFELSSRIEITGERRTIVQGIRLPRRIRQELNLSLGTRLSVGYLLLSKKRGGGNRIEPRRFGPYGDEDDVSIPMCVQRCVLHRRKGGR